MANFAEASIEVALETRLQSLVTTPILPILWEGKSSDPPSNRKYLVALYVPNTATRVFIGSNDPHQHIGLFQINLHWPLGDFARVARDIAGAIVAHFPADLELVQDGVTVRITKRPDAAGLLTGKVDMEIPILIPFEAWA